MKKIKVSYQEEKVVFKGKECLGKRIVYQENLVIENADGLKEIKKGMLGPIIIDGDLDIFKKSKDGFFISDETIISDYTHRLRISDGTIISGCSIVDIIPLVNQWRAVEETSLINIGKNTNIKDTKIYIDHLTTTNIYNVKIEDSILENPFDVNDARICKSVLKNTAIKHSFVKNAKLTSFALEHSSVENIVVDDVSVLFKKIKIKNGIIKDIFDIAIIPFINFERYSYKTDDIANDNWIIEDAENNSILTNAKERYYTPKNKSQFLYYYFNQCLSSENFARKLFIGIRNTFNLSQQRDLRGVLDWAYRYSDIIMESMCRNSMDEQIESIIKLDILKGTVNETYAFLERNTMKQIMSTFSAGISEEEVLKRLKNNKIIVMDLNNVLRTILN